MIQEIRSIIIIHKKILETIGKKQAM